MRLDRGISEPFNVIIANYVWFVKILNDSNRHVVQLSEILYFSLSFPITHKVSNVGIFVLLKFKNKLDGKYNKEINSSCTLCQGAQETVIHLPIECSHAKKMWSAFKKYFDQKLYASIELSNKDIIFNNYDGAEKHVINSLIAIMKQHIYASKCFGNAPNFIEYMSKVSDYYIMEKYQAKDNLKMERFRKKWKVIF